VIRDLSDRPIVRRASHVGAAITIVFACLVFASAMGLLRVPYLGAALPVIVVIEFTRRRACTGRWWPDLRGP
jgi:4-hydroxybenzoate polyprenyltransferase